jgi:predicted RNA binding protein YcfA (HicA-like mRNA interferase family)
VRARELLRILRRYEQCVELRRNATHIQIRCGTCHTTVVDHKGEDIGKGLLRRIERDLEPCLGKGWLRQ